MIEKTYRVHFNEPTTAEWIWNYRVKAVLRNHIDAYVKEEFDKLMLEIEKDVREEYPVVLGLMGCPIRLFTRREYADAMFVFPRKIHIDSDNNAVIRVCWHFDMMKADTKFSSDGKTVKEVLSAAVDDCFANFSQYIDRLGANEETEKLLMVEPMIEVKEEAK